MSDATRANPSTLALDAYQQQVAGAYAARAAGYDSAPGNADWHRRMAAQLVQRAPIQAGQSVLDIATGTGLVALDVAARVGAAGRVLGIDIAAPMLQQAQRKAAGQGLAQVSFEPRDAEATGLPPASFDHVLCCAALVLMRDIAQVLAHWRSLLRPGGWIGLQTHPETAFVSSRALQGLAAEQGIDLRLHREVGTPARLRALLQGAGFADIDIHTEPDGYWLSLEQALSFGPDSHFPAPGQYPPPLAACTPAQLQALREGYAAAMQAACTPQGIWNDCTSLFARARLAGV
ncbi:class I SAM-dependent methyltransferase [Thiomonas sp. X19]|uniref:class I SAM-dependent methyltransferase n=1 Tax=Thiomonas sp. X19 TaxID=1050370 RepID=UPI001313F6BA|nr:class I SAM-dependent methyltransferase [Thiomonas sp. X19]